MNLLQQSIEEHSLIFENIDIQPDDIDYSTAKNYLPFLKLIDSLKTSIIISYDFYKQDYFYFSECFNEVFGFHENKLPKANHKFMRSRFHPDDFIINTGSAQALQYIYQQPINKRKDYQLIHEFRILNDTGKYIRLIIQNYLLELDKKGNLWLDLKLCDFSPDQDLNKPGQFILREKYSGDVIFSLNGKSSESNTISNREKEVLELISKGERSDQIADNLSISVNTVNNHRRNLIKKLNVSNSSEAVTLAIKLGII